MKEYQKSLFIFRRDLRLPDNTALLAAHAASLEVMPVFIFEPRQYDASKNEYKSENAVQFMVASLRDLAGQIKKKGGRLYLFDGDTFKVLKSIIRKAEIDAVYFNKDYTPFARRRDACIERLCKELKVEVHSYDDVLITAPDEVLTNDGQPYRVFTSYYKKAATFGIKKPVQHRYDNFGGAGAKLSHQISDGDMDEFYEYNENIFVEGGRKLAQKMLASPSRLDDYEQAHNVPSMETSHLSAYIKFGCLSIREVADLFGKRLHHPESLVRQLYWHDFYTQLAYHFPYVFGKGLKDTYAKVKWRDDIKQFNAWKAGKTGYPLIDAAMRQLAVSGFMPNRMRMLVASFLVKSLLIDWRRGERYFAQKLVDYDPSVNNGNWQWVAGCGSDYRNRMFNPWTQSKKYDPDGDYIKTWVVELKEVPPRELHRWDKVFEKYPQIKYPEPIVDHAMAYARFKRILLKK